MNLITMDPVWRPENQQKGFRALLDAMSFPGKVLDLREALGESRAELGILACLIDDAVTYADPDNRLDARERGLLHSELVAPEVADYILQVAAHPPRPEFQPKLGTLYRPDSAATLILCGGEVGNGAQSLRLEGPGIERQTELRLEGFDIAWFERRTKWVSNFPQGIDIFLCDHVCVAALPRTCRVRF